MYCFSETKRPHASYTCPGCRQINVLEASDLTAEQGLVSVSCLSCGRDHGIEQSYMRSQLQRDQAAD